MKLYQFYQGNRIFAVKNVENYDGRLEGELVGYADGALNDGRIVFQRVDPTHFEASGTWTLIGFMGVFRDEIE